MMPAYLKPAFVKVIFFCIVLFFCESTSAQNSFSIKGVVIDSVQSKPLKGATVTIQKISDQSSRNAITGETGNFKIEISDTGYYTALISFTGFSKKKINFNLINNIDLGNINLLPEAANLSGVTVTAKRQLIEHTDDKIIYNVENDPMAKAEMAIDILRRTPFVSVDGDNNVRLAGQTNFKVLLNGRETAMFAQNPKDALQGFPGASIVKIEVITNPSAKYDAEGIGGIINIITKKKIEGYNGSIFSWTSSQNQFLVNTNFNAKFNKIGIAINHGLRYTPHFEANFFSHTVPFNTAFYNSRLIEGVRQSTTFSQFGNAEISLMADSLNTFSFYGNVSGGSSKQFLDQEVTTKFDNSTSYTNYFDQHNRRIYPTNTIGTDYIKRFAGKPDKEFSLRLNAELGENNAFLESEEKSINTERYIINNSIATNRQYTLQTDYVHPLTNGRKLEVGARATLRRATSNFESLIKFNHLHQYKTNPNNTDNFRFFQDVYSAYASYSFKIKSYNFRTGLRIEQTSINGNFNSAKAFAKNSYVNFLPNFQASTRINTLSLVLSYGQRLQRPYIAHLNPFIDNNDSLNISYGNPNLDAQTIHTVSASGKLQKGKTFMGLTFSGSYNNNMIVTLISFDPAKGVRSSTYENLGVDWMFKVNGNVSTSFGKGWGLNANVDLIYRMIENKSDEAIKNKGIAGNTSLGLNYNLSSIFAANAYVGFEQSVIDLQTSPNTIPYCGTGINYQVVKNKLRLGLVFQNYFATYYDYTTVTKSPHFTSTFTSHSPFRKIVLTVNWNFGKLKENVSKKRGITNDDLL